MICYVHSGIGCNVIYSYIYTYISTYTSEKKVDFESRKFGWVIAHPEMIFGHPVNRVFALTTK